MLSVDAGVVTSTTDVVSSTKEDRTSSVDAVPLPMPTAAQDSFMSVDAEPLSSTTDDDSTKEDESSDEFFDAGIVYYESDLDKVNCLIQQLEANAILENGEKPKIELFDIISPDCYLISQIDTLIRHCSCIIIYLTKEFLGDSTLLFKTNEILMNTLNQNKNSKNWPLMFLAHEPVDLPIGMKSICITKLYMNQNLALRKLKKMLQTGQKNRKMKEKQFLNSQRRPGISREQSMTLGNPFLSPEINHKPIVYNINVSATNVQIGDNNAMYGVTLGSPNPEISDGDQAPSPQIRYLPPTPTHLPTPSLEPRRTAEGMTYESNISETNLQIPATLVTLKQQEPDSTSETLN